MNYVGELMTKFYITATKRNGESSKQFIYDNMDSTLTDINGNQIVETRIGNSRPIPHKTSRNNPAGKISDIKTLKIQLGLSCNYSCEYCSQRFVPHSDSTNPNDIKPFMDNLPNWFDGGVDGKGSGVRVEFWGGEPFVYWKTFKPLAEAIKEKYPNIRPSVITNGSLLDEEKVDWLDKMGFLVGFSHDGPGQSIRGPDPFEDEKSAAGIYALFRVLGHERVSVNSMLHKDNSSRIAIIEWMKDKLGEGVRVGEGTFIDPYDEGGLEMSAPSGEWMVQFARNSFNEMDRHGIDSMSIVPDKVHRFINSVINGERAESIGQKCGMDDPRNIAVDLNGNVLTCQNVSASSVAPNGLSHKIGNVNNLSEVSLNTSTHWSERKDCSSCPVLQLCAGGCMFLEGERWERGCDNSFIDNWSLFAKGFEILTGYVPHTIEGEGMREDRKTPFHYIPETKKKKVFEIKPI